MSMLGMMASLHQTKLVGHSALAFLLWKHNLAPGLITIHNTTSLIGCIFGWSASIILAFTSGLLGIGQVVQNSRIFKLYSSSQESYPEMEKVLTRSDKHTKVHYLHSPIHKARAHSRTIFSIVDPPEERHYHHHRKDDTIMMEQIKDGIHVLHFYDLESGRSSYQSSAANSLDHIPIIGQPINAFNNSSNYLNNWQWKQRMQRAPQNLVKYDIPAKDKAEITLPKSEEKSPALPRDPFERITALSRKTSPFRFTDSKTKELQATLDKKDTTPLFDASNELSLQSTPSMKEPSVTTDSSQQLEEVDMKTPPKSTHFQQVIA